jgi:hypothetical protein
VVMADVVIVVTVDMVSNLRVRKLFRGVRCG